MLPFRLMPGPEFLPVPSVLYNGLLDAAAAYKWIIYIPGPTVGNAINLVVTFLIPAAYSLWFFRLFKRLSVRFVIPVIRGVPLSKA